MKTCFVIACILIAYVTFSSADDDGRCPSVCTRELRPVCGETIRNGKRITCTLSNPCELKRLICRSNLKWRKISERKCAKPSGCCKRLLAAG